MALERVPISALSSEAWDQVVRISPDGWVFALHAWQALVVEVEPWGFEEHGFGLMQDGQLVAVCPLHFSRPARLLASSGWGGAGPILRNSVDSKARPSLYRDAIEACAEVGRNVAAEKLEIWVSSVTRTSLTAPWGVNPLMLAGLKDSSGLSQVISLEADEETLWAGLSKTARNLIRRAKDAGFYAETVTWEAHLDAYYDLHVETYWRTGVKPHPRAYFEGIARRIAPLGSAHLVALKTSSGEIQAFHSTAQLGVGATYHTGCSRDSSQANSIGYLLMWEAILAAKRRGAHWYDCGWIFPDATDKKQQGLSLFKTRFGGEPHRAFRGELAFKVPQVAEAVPAPPAQPQRPSSLRFVSRVGSRVARLLRAHRGSAHG